MNIGVYAINFVVRYQIVHSELTTLPAKSQLRPSRADQGWAGKYGFGL